MGLIKYPHQILILVLQNKIWNTKLIIWQDSIKLNVKRGDKRFISFFIRTDIIVNICDMIFTY